MESKEKHVIVFLPFKCHCYNEQSWLLRRRLIPTSPLMPLLLMSSRLLFVFPVCWGKMNTQVTTTVEKNPLLTRQGIKQIKIIWNHKMIDLTCPMELCNENRKTQQIEIFLWVYIFLWVSIAAKFTMNTRGQHNTEEPIGWYWPPSIVSLILTWHIKSRSFTWTKLLTKVDKFNRKYVRCA